MKKLSVLVLALVLCMSFALAAQAGSYSIQENGNAIYDTAIGYIFDIRAINDKITGEDAVIMTSNEHTAKTGVWSCWTIAEEIDDTGVYRAIKSAEPMTGASPDITLDPGQIYIVVHSSTSNPVEAAEKNWQNWEDKVAFLAVQGGDCFVFQGIDFDKGTCVNGKMMCLTEEDALNGNYSWDGNTETSTPAESETETSAPAESETETSTPAESEDNAESTAETESTVETESKDEASEAESKVEIIDDSEIASSDIEIDGEEGLGVWLWVIIGAAVVVVVIIVAVVAKKK